MTTFLTTVAQLAFVVVVAFWAVSAFCDAQGRKTR